jgi:hypothetical protein
MSYFLLWVSFGILTAIVAGIKGRSVIGWFLLGFLFSFFALIVLLVLPKAASVANQTKTCSDCTEVIPLMARVCKHCGKRYDNEVDRIEARINEVKQQNSELLAINEQELEWLANKGIHDINGFNRDNQTPLMVYALKNDFETVEKLLVAGADAGIRNMAGFTAADKAEREGLEEIATYIRNYKLS